MFEPGSYSLCGSPPDQPLHQMPNLPTPHLTDQQGRTHDQTEIPGSYASVETHTMFSVAQAGTAQCAPQESNKFLHSEVTPMEIQSGITEGSAQQDQRVLNYECRIRRSIPVSNPAGSATDHGLHVNMSALSASQQTGLVTTPSGSISNQNLYTSGSGSGTHHPTYVSTSVSISHQNLCVSTHQNVYVTPPVQSITDHKFCVSSPSVLNSQQNINVSIASGRTVSETTDECGEQVMPDGGFIPSAEGRNLDTHNPWGPSSKSHIPPRLLLPGPSDSLPSDCESEVKISSTQTESSA